MLKKAHITNIQMLSEEWFQGRLAKFTASENHFLMGREPLTQEALKYTYRKVYEELSGLPSKDPVNTRATEHGHKYENEGILEFGKSIGIEYVVIQKLISIPGSRFTCTPDFLIPVREHSDKLSYEVKTGEVKCPLGDNFIELARCKTPADVYKVNKIYFWQPIYQMDACEALTGYLVIYNPFVRVGKLNVIEFRKRELIKEFKLVTERKAFFENYFMEVRDEFLNK